MVGVSAPLQPAASVTWSPSATPASAGGQPTARDGCGGEPSQPSRMPASGPHRASLARPGFGRGELGQRIAPAPRFPASAGACVAGAPRSTRAHSRNGAAWAGTSVPARSGSTRLRGSEPAASPAGRRDRASARPASSGRHGRRPLGTAAGSMSSERTSVRPQLSARRRGPRTDACPSSGGQGRTSVRVRPRERDTSRRRARRRRRRRSPGFGPWSGARRSVEAPHDRRPGAPGSTPHLGAARAAVLHTGCHPTVRRRLPGSLAGFGPRSSTERSVEAARLAGRKRWWMLPHLGAVAAAGSTRSVARRLVSQPLSPSRVSARVRCQDRRSRSCTGRLRSTLRAVLRHRPLRLATPAARMVSSPSRSAVRLRFHAPPGWHDASPACTTFRAASPASAGGAAGLRRAPEGTGHTRSTGRLACSEIPVTIAHDAATRGARDARQGVSTASEADSGLCPFRVAGPRTVALNGRNERQEGTGRREVARLLERRKL
jgi:hypothetical protein